LIGPSTVASLIRRINCAIIPGASYELSLGQLDKTGRSPTVQRKAVAFVR
jgi:hypothetical protein